MAKIKIKEGSLDVEVGPSRGKPVATASYHAHGKGNMVFIEFETWGTKYKFKEGKLKKGKPVKSTAAAKAKKRRIK